MFILNSNVFEELFSRKPNIYSLPIICAAVSHEIQLKFEIAYIPFLNQIT